MNKKLISFLFIIILFLIATVSFTKIFQSPMITLSTKIQSTYLSLIYTFKKTINEHTLQAKHIKELQKKLLKYQKNYLITQQLYSQINQLFKENNSAMSVNPKVELVRAISYVKFSNLNKLWIQMNDFNKSKIYGLVYQTKVAGIVVARENKPMALLIQDPKCSYPVFIGSNNAPGIAHGNNNGNIIVDYIPLWIKINIGDKVITSGLGKMFFKGLSVGIVSKIIQIQGYKQAIIKPSFTSNTLNYFYAIKDVL